MKQVTKLALIAGALLIASTIYSQVKVASNGYIGILSSSAPVSPLAVNCVGAATQKVAISGETIGLYSLRTGTPTGSWVYSIVGDNNVLGGSWNIGIKANSVGTSNGGRSFGLLGVSGNSTTGYNYGVYGTVVGTQNGAGVIGTTNYNLDVNVPGIYAGYFVGNVCATGSMSANSYITTSDRRLKKNIAKMDRAKSLNSILSLNPVEYNLIPRAHKSKGDSASVDRLDNDEKAQTYQKKHFGLVAQELQAIYPDLVYEDSEGYLAINYTGIIPLLIESIKELKEEVKTSNASYTVANPATSALSAKITATGIIQYNLNKTVGSAAVLVFDMQGKLLKSVPIVGRGKGSIAVSDDTMASGMYIYSLVADGAELESQRLIYSVN